MYYVLILGHMVTRKAKGLQVNEKTYSFSPYQQSRGEELKCPYSQLSQMIRCSQDSEEHEEQHFGLQADTPTHTEPSRIQGRLLCPTSCMSNFSSSSLVLLYEASSLTVTRKFKTCFFLISAFSSHLPATTGLFSPQPQGNYSLVPSVSTLDRVGIVWGWLYFGFCRKGRRKAVRLITQTYSNAYLLCTIVLRAPWFLSPVLDAIPNVNFSSC